MPCTSFSSSQPTYAYKIYRKCRRLYMLKCLLTTYICIQDISRNFHIHNGNFYTHNLHMHTRYIYKEHYPFFTYKLTTYICIQDISVFDFSHHIINTLTTYICIQDISRETDDPARIRKLSQPTYAYKIYHQINTNISCLQGLNL